MKHKAVIGLGFGDCGKGLVVDHLASRLPDSLTVRFSGGHQAGHTVVSNGIRHVFSNFGAGTLQGLPTYWRETCTVCPVGLTNELRILKDKGVDPRILIHDNCPVVTPMDRAANRAREEKDKHGSCGVGFGETIQREEDYYSLRFIDIFYPDILAERLKNIADYYYRGHDASEDICADMEEFIERCREISEAKEIERTSGVFSPDESCIFEGSQGLLLDQNYGFFPNVTRSNTGSTNIAKFARETEWYLVTRAYQTRHGNGFMTNEDRPHNIKKNENETNVTNYQGEFRRTLLDVSLLEYAISRDDIIRRARNRVLVITCMDHIENEYRFTYKGEIVFCSDMEDFARKVADRLCITRVLVSMSDDGTQIEEVSI